ncbi:MAG: 5'/3'-nucleotidase SurE [Clostridiales bacterium]|nr:5'/3'-nucleotidase SurE [Clostridiales bacterium]
MRLLITNDDGIEAKGILALARAAATRGHHAVVCAPAAQCSANSQHITLDRPLMLYARDIPGTEAYAVDGTPSDCVRIAAAVSKEPFDVCISGINRGENVGAGIYYSGTVSAAREAAMTYVPAIAVSLAYGGSERALDALAVMAVELAEQCRSISFPRMGVLNVNAPACEPETWRERVFCPISGAFFLDRYAERVSPLGQRYFWLGQEGDSEGTLCMEPHLPGTDADLLAKGHVTMTMIGSLSDLNDSFAAEFAKREGRA